MRPRTIPVTGYLVSGPDATAAAFAVISRRLSRSVPPGDTGQVGTSPGCRWPPGLLSGKYTRNTEFPVDDHRAALA